MFESFDSTIMAWGSNESYQFGLYLKRNIQSYYEIEAAQSVDVKI